MTSDANLPSVYPILRYEDPAKAIRFLTEAFGFNEHAAYEGGDGAIVHAQVTWDTGLIMLGPSSPESPFDLGPSVVYVAVTDPDAHHDRAVAAGAEIVVGLADQDYGSREYAARDPEGNVWCFGTYRPGPGAA